MPIYSVIRKSDQVEVYRYQADEPVEWSGMEFDTHDHIEVVEQGVPSAPVGGRVMSKLEFLRLFTVPERVAIRTMAKENPILEDYMAMVDMANEIDTSDTDTRTGVQMLEQVGLIAPGRALEILNG